VPAREIVVLHDPEAEKSLVILFFETDADYQRGDEVLNAMPASDTRVRQIGHEVSGRVPHEGLASAPVPRSMARPHDSAR
jgi:hypothetical protein